MAPDVRRIRIASDGDIITARREGRAIASGLHFSSTDLTLIATAISEMARNILVYARTGEIELGIAAREEDLRGIRVVARDKGPGIPDIELAMRDDYSTGQGLGLGLPGTRRLMDDFEVESAPGMGTTVRMTKWETRRA